MKKMPKFLYHTTLKSNLTSIKQKGLQPSFSKSSLNACFLTDDLYVAKNYKCMLNGESVILKISVEQLKIDRFGPDNYELKDFLDHNKTKYKAWNECSALESLKLCNQLAYYDIIEFKCIKEVFYE